jgi:hypothetical protein
VNEDRLDGRCGSCARFVRVTETIDDNGEVRRSGECLLAVWPPPIYETNTCSRYVRKGTFVLAPAKVARKRPSEIAEEGSSPRADGTRGAFTFPGRADELPSRSRSVVLPEELLSMDADEFRRVLRDVLQDELGVRPVDLGGRWMGGEVVLKPGKEGTAEKSIPIEALFHKIVMIRDRLRVLEQRINAHPKLSEEEKLQMQQYVTQCYGSLTTFNVLFADRRDAFVGQKGDD